MNLYIDIDNTICSTPVDGKDKYDRSVPIYDRIAEVNRLYNEGNIITYWTARGSASHVDYTELTKKQLAEWGCLYHHLQMNKPAYDLYVDDKCCHSDTFFAHTQLKQHAQKVEKGWGSEIIFANNDKYCGKLLQFNTGAMFSMHYHMIKQETWFVQSGVFIFKYIDTKTADIHEQHLSVGDVVTNNIGQPHQLICVSEGTIVEVSTTHYDSDSYRIWKGDSQQKH
jgi:mannose-6-phosphate isomerase-like protein (cupin superfamily)